jgi:hypothetical protein
MNKPARKAMEQPAPQNAGKKKECFRFELNADYLRILLKQRAAEENMTENEVIIKAATLYLNGGKEKNPLLEKLDGLLRQAGLLEKRLITAEPAGRQREGANVKR